MRVRFPISLALVALVATPVGSGFSRTISAQQEPDQKWDITAPLGPTTSLEFDTSEGTWMNLDVSPDGRRILCDLLGDIYEMPIDGSRSSPAKRLTSGPAFDMQPRYSPDGSRVAFASDRDGLWNIWTMNAEGSETGMRWITYSIGC